MLEQTAESESQSEVRIRDSRITTRSMSRHGDKVRSRQWKCSVMSSEPAHRCIFTEHTHVGDWVVDVMDAGDDHRISIGGTTLGARRPTDVKAHVPLGKRWQDGGSRRAARVLLGRHS